MDILICLAQSCPPLAVFVAAMVTGVTLGAACGLILFDLV